jgi:hypothetical protein
MVSATGADVGLLGAQTGRTAPEDQVIALTATYRECTMPVLADVKKAAPGRTVILSMVKER